MKFFRVAPAWANAVEVSIRSEIFGLRVSGGLTARLFHSPSPEMAPRLTLRCLHHCQQSCEIVTRYRSATVADFNGLPCICEWLPGSFHHEPGLDKENHTRCLAHSRTSLFIEVEKDATKSSKPCAKTSAVEIFEGESNTNSSTSHPPTLTK